MGKKTTILTVRESAATYAPGQERIRQVRRLRAVAEFLWQSADQCQATMVKKAGLKRYIFSALGNAARCPATGCHIVWSDRVDHVNGVDGTLGDYVYEVAERERDLPRAVVTADGHKYYL